MLRITSVANHTVQVRAAASMRPQRDAADNDLHIPLHSDSARQASMRPQRDAADNHGKLAKHDK